MSRSILGEIDDSTPELWARSLLQRVKAMTEIDLHLIKTRDGSLYTHEDFMWDTWGGDVPWSDPLRGQVLMILRNLPDFAGINLEFKNRFGIPFWNLEKFDRYLESLQEEMIDNA